MTLAQLRVRGTTMELASRSDKERVGRLAARAHEAEAALQRMRSYVQLLRLKSAASSVPSSWAEPNGAAAVEEAAALERQNEMLRLEVTNLLKQLTELETRNEWRRSTPTSQQQQQQQQQPPTPPVVKAKPEKKANPPKCSSSATAEKAVDVSRLDLRVGRITSVCRHPDADTLYVEEVDVGEEQTRTVCSGLVKHVAMESLQGRLVVMLCNLKPAKMRGVLSQAMVMCASSPDQVELLDPPPDCHPGDKVTFQSFMGSPDAQLNPKKKIFENIQPDFLVDEAGVACYRDEPFTVEGKGECRAKTMRCVGIK